MASHRITPSDRRCARVDATHPDGGGAVEAGVCNSRSRSGATTLTIARKGPPVRGPFLVRDSQELVARSAYKRQRQEHPDA
jgi:hypothetical protein